MRKIILLKKSDTCWVAKHSDPEVRELFGTDTIPTAFTNAAPYPEVARRIRELNPDAIVTLSLEGNK